MSTGEHEPRLPSQVSAPQWPTIASEVFPSVQLSNDEASRPLTVRDLLEQEAAKRASMQAHLGEKFFPATLFSQPTAEQTTVAQQIPTRVHDRKLVFPSLCTEYEFAGRVGLAACNVLFSMPRVPVPLSIFRASGVTRGFEQRLSAITKALNDETDFEIIESALVYGERVYAVSPNIYFEEGRSRYLPFISARRSQI